MVVLLIFCFRVNSNYVGKTFLCVAWFNLLIKFNYLHFNKIANSMRVFAVVSVYLPNFAAQINQVSMNNFRKIIIWISAMCFLAVVTVSCSDSDNNDGGGNYRRTVILYMAAQNSLGASSCAVSDSLEVVDGASALLAEKDNIIMFIDDAKYPRIHRIFKSAEGKLYSTPVYQYNYDANSGDASTLQDVLSRVRSLYPSDSYGLVMWSHGMGWLPELMSLSPRAASRGICIDVGPNGNMSTDKKSNGDLGSQMSITAMASAIQNSGIHFDYIFFDACLMQSLEVAWDLRKVTDYMVSSPTMTSSYGAYYSDQIRNGFFAYPTNDINIQKIVDTYYYDVMENPQTYRYYEDQGCVMSVIKMSELENLTAATTSCIRTAMKDDRARSLSNFMYGYVSYEYTGYPDFFDPSVAFHELLPQADYEVWRDALDRCVIYRKGSYDYYIGMRARVIKKGIFDKEYGSCVSMFFPQAKYNVRRDFLDFNNAIMDTNWYKDVWPKD